MGVVDFHNHVIPGVDDGAQESAQSVAAIESLIADGVSVLVATPHFDASRTLDGAALQQRMSELDDGWQRLRACSAAFPEVRIERGAELALDVPEPDLSDARLRLGGGTFFLMEFPFMTVPPQSPRVIEAITAQGYTPIIAHPERYSGFQAHLDLAAEWRENGALLQVNGGSLLGRYGRDARNNASELLARGWVDYLASDYHARGPCLVAQYRGLLEEADAGELAQTLMETNPLRMLEGLRPIPVPPLRQKRTLWGRVSAIFGS